MKLLVAMGLAVVVASAGGAHVARGAAVVQRVRLYALPATAQFMNHADDRVRGMTINPFNVNVKSLEVVLASNGKEKGHGPFPGDDVLYTFTMYSNASLTHRAGAAMFTCYYGFHKRAFCDSYFELTQGLVLAAGEITFNSAHFLLGVTGGTVGYLGVTGQLQVSSAPKGALVLDLSLLPASK